jgi:hypothetical protein
VPARDVITLSVSDQALLNTDAIITDLNGKVVQRFRVTQLVQEVNVNALLPGVYFVRTNDGSVGRIVKQ